MEGVLRWLGIFLLVDLAFDIVLIVAFWIRARRTQRPEESAAARGFLAASGCLTLCLAFLYAGLWMFSKVSW